MVKFTKFGNVKAAEMFIFKSQVFFKLADGLHAANMTTGNVCRFDQAETVDLPESAKLTIKV